MSDEPDTRRTVSLRHEVHSLDRRFLEAYLDRHGDLHFEGQDLGPSTAMVSGDGEYEYFRMVAAEHLDDLRGLLDISAGEDLLDALAARWSGDASYELERRLSRASFPVKLSVW
jgi:hypothetical protein